MKLSHYDRALIHGLGVLSRPPLMEAVQHRMVADLVAFAADRATARGAMLALIHAASKVGPTPQIHRGTMHEIAAAMNDFDREAMGAHLDAARGVAP